MVVVLGCCRLGMLMVLVGVCYSGGIVGVGCCYVWLLVYCSVGMVWFSCSCDIVVLVCSRGGF